MWTSFHKYLIFWVLLVFVFSHSVAYSQTTAKKNKLKKSELNLRDTTETQAASQTQYRRYSVHQAFLADSIFEAPVFEAFEGFGIAATKGLVRIIMLESNTMLLTEKRTASFWNKTYCFVYQTFKTGTTNKSFAMAVLSPIFVLFLGVYFFVKGIPIFLFKPDLKDPKKLMDYERFGADYMLAYGATDELSESKSGMKLSPGSNVSSGGDKNS